MDIGVVALRMIVQIVPRSVYFVTGSLSTLIPDSPVFDIEPIIRLNIRRSCPNHGASLQYRPGLLCSHRVRSILQLPIPLIAASSSEPRTMDTDSLFILARFYLVMTLVL